MLKYCDLVEIYPTQCSSACETVCAQSLEFVCFRHCLVFLGHSLRDCFKFVMVVACAELILRSQYEEGSPVYFLQVFV